MRIIFGCFISFFITCFAGSHVHAEIRAVASIKPIHSLVASVMDGVATPELLLTGNATPHSFSFKPSDIQKVNRADIVFWIGPELESSLLKLLESLPTGTVQSIIDWPEIDILQTRAAGVFSAEDDIHHHETSNSGHQHREGERDPHVWLNPDNATAIVSKIVGELIQIDPKNEITYRRNGEKTIRRIQRQKEELQAQLLAVSQQPFIVFHDAYHYFEEAFPLNNRGAVSINPEKQPGAKRIYQLRKLIESEGILAVFVEPQFSDKLSHSLVDGSRAKMVTIDPLGAKINEGPDAYFELMHELAANILIGLVDK